MIWQSPAAWVGLTAVAVPILVHLLARRQAARVRFPTLRFLRVSQTASVRRSRLNDPWLLLIRGGVLAAAVAALAQPYVTTAPRVRASTATLSRAVVIDTSDRMKRSGAGGASALEVARRTAAAMKPDASATRIIEAPFLPDGIRAARAWLDASPGLHEIAVISDFHLGALTAGDVSSLPKEMGIRISKIDALPAPPLPAQTLLTDRGEMRASVTIDADRTLARWTTAAGPPRLSPPEILSGPASRARLQAALAAAETEGAVQTQAGSRFDVAVIFPDAADRSSKAGAAGPFHERWMFDVVNRLRRDPTFVSIAERAPSFGPALPYSTNLIAVSESGLGLPLLSAGSSEASPSVLELFPATGDLDFAAALFSAIFRSRSSEDAADFAAYEPAGIPAAELASWQRPAVDSANPRPPHGESDGRWFWMLSLALLVLEAWFRRERSEQAGEAAHARVA